MDAIDSAKAEGGADWRFCRRSKIPRSWRGRCAAGEWTRPRSSVGRPTRPIQESALAPACGLRRLLQLRQETGAQVRGECMVFKLSSWSCPTAMAGACQAQELASGNGNMKMDCGHSASAP